MGTDNGTIEQAVLKEGLCIGCGLCAAVCPGNAIRMQWVNELFWSPETQKEKCTNCGICLRVCPNAPANIRECAEAAFNKGERFGLEDSASHFIAYDLNINARRESASGGVLTAVLKHLLATGKAKGVLASVPVRASIGQPHYEIRVIRSTEGLDNARSSHYYPACYKKALDEIKNDPGKYALVGVPCVIRGVKKLPAGLLDSISYVIGLACSHNVTGRFLDSLARQEGVIPGEDFTANLRDKHGSIKDADNFNNHFVLGHREIRVNRFDSAFTAMWRNYFFAKECCLYCPDFYAAQADISVKDAWGRLSRDPLGISFISVRNASLGDVLSRMKDEGILHLERCGSGEVFRSQPQTPGFKQVEVLNRIRLKTVLRKEFPGRAFKSDALKKPFIKSVIEHVYFRSMIVLSNFFYPRWSRSFARVTAFSSRFIMRALIFGTEIASLGIKVLESLVSPIIYTLAGLVRYPLVPVPEKEKKAARSLNVLVLGGYGYSNVGDEAQLSRVIQNWKRSNCDVDLTILSPNPEYTKKVHGERAEKAPRTVLFESNKIGNYTRSNILFRWRYRWIKPRMLFFARLYAKNKALPGAYPEEMKLLKLIDDADVVHFSGGGYLTGMTLSRLWDGMLIINIADILSTPVILSGQTIGVFRDRMSKKLAKWGLSKAKMIYLRDPEGSKKDIELLGVKGPEIKVAFDDALFCDIAEEEKVVTCLKENGVLPDKPCAVINVHYFKQRKKMSGKCMERIAEICDHIVSGYGFQTVFLPLVPTDVGAIEGTRRKMAETSYIIDYGFDYRIAKGVISRANFMFTMKHHGIIFAMGSKVPTIAVSLDDYYLRKNFGALSLFGQERFSLDEKQLFSGNIAEDTIRDLLADEDSIKSEISGNLERMRSMDGEVIYKFLKSHKTR